MSEDLKCSLSKPIRYSTWPRYVASLDLPEEQQTDEFDEDREQQRGNQQTDDAQDRADCRDNQSRALDRLWRCFLGRRSPSVTPYCAL